QQQISSRTVTPDLTTFTPLSPSRNDTPSLSQPLQPISGALSGMTPLQPQPSNWGPTASNSWGTVQSRSSPSFSTLGNMNTSMSSMSLSQNSGNTPAFSIPPPPSSQSSFQTRQPS